MTKLYQRVVLVLLALIVPSKNIHSMFLSPPTQHFKRARIGASTSTSLVQCMAMSTQITSRDVHADSKGSVWSNRQFSWTIIFKTPTIWLFHGNDDRIVSEKLYRRKGNQIFSYLPRCLKSIRLRFFWMASLLFWWCVAIPRATASITATSPSAPVLQFTMEPREAFAHPKDKVHSDAESPNMAVPSQRDLSSSIEKRQERIRCITGSAVILTTALVGVGKVNRRKREESQTSRDMDDDSVGVAELDPKNQELKWLYPRSPSENHELPSMKEVEADAINSPTPPFLSSANKIIEDAKVIASQKLKTNMINSSRRNSYVSTSNNNKTSSSLNNKKVIYRQQQPKSPIEEARLQAKYAAIESLEERAFTVLVDLGMVELSDPFDSAWQ